MVKHGSGNHGNDSDNHGVLRQTQGQHLKLKSLTWAGQVGTETQPQTLSKSLVSGDLGMVSYRYDASRSLP